MNNTINYYELLGVSQSASEEEIKKAYKAQMKIWHPDINKAENASEMSTKINTAKEVLLDASKRAEYDAYLASSKENDYQKYNGKAKGNPNYTSAEHAQYESEKVTKWQYFFQWLKYAQVPLYRKIIGSIGVMLESLLCSLISLFIIIFAYVSNVGAQVISFLIKTLSGVMGLLLILFIAQCTQNGFAETIKGIDAETLKLTIGLVVLFIVGLILPLLSRLVMSPKVFDFLYNQINIVLFKKCVGYHD